MKGGRKIVFIAAAHPVEAGLARQQELADGLTSPSALRNEIPVGL
jgi:hypothetical protein